MNIRILMLGIGICHFAAVMVAKIGWIESTEVFRAAGLVIANVWIVGMFCAKDLK